MLSFAYNSTASSLLTTLQSREGTNKPQLVIITSNAAPTVSLQAPTSSDNFTAPATFSIIASAADSDGNIQKVEFYNGAALLGSATQSPYLYDWLNVAAGSYTLTAKAFDNANASTISAPVNITVNAPQVAAGIYYIFADHLNTARVITDQANKTVWRWESDPFGTSAPFEDPDGDGVKFVHNPRFPGQYFDAETGLHQNYFRDYDPSSGRYVQSDPIGLSGGINTFGYANQNPISFIDPLGLCPAGTSFVWDERLRNYVCSPPQTAACANGDFQCAAGIQTVWDPTSVEECSLKCSIEAYIAGAPAEHGANAATKKVTDGATTLGVSFRYVVKKTFVVSGIFDIAACIKKCRSQFACEK